MTRKKTWMLVCVGLALLCAAALAWGLRKEPEVDMNEIVTVYCLSQVRQSRNGEEMWTNLEYEYDEYGNIIRSTVYYSDISGYDPATTLYEYDARGNMTRCSDSYSDTVYTYDENDRLLTEEAHSHNGITAHYYTYCYDDAGRLTYQKEARYWRDEATVTEMINTYDEQGNLIKTENFYNDEAMATQLYTYDEKNQMIKKESVFQGRVSETATYTYDGEGRLLHYKEEMYDTPERATEIYREYDVRGNQISYKRYIGGKLQNDDTNRYDLFGRLISTKEMRGDSVSYQATYTYDILGRLIQTVALEPPQISIDYVPAEYNVVYTYQYDQRGNMVKQVMKHGKYGTEIRTREYDRNGNLLAWESGDYRMEWTYDQAGNLTRRYVRFSEDSEYHYEYVYITVRVPRWLAEKILEEQEEIMLPYQPL